ncbi:MAG: hypothetical protein AAGG08_15235 [Actinomycetota bacterium]
MTDWTDLTARAGRAGHDLTGWLMWDPAAIGAYDARGVPHGVGWILAWRLAPLGDVAPGAAAAATFSISPPVIEMILGAWHGVTDLDAIRSVRDAAIAPALAEIAPGLSESIAPLADDLWRGVDETHHGARTLFAANKFQERPADDPLLSAWLASNTLRELRGDNHWALCVAADLDDVEVGLLHSAMIDVEEYGGEEWIARSRGADDAAIARGWRRLAAKGWAADQALTDAGRAFRLELEATTDELTAPAWQAVGEAATVAYLGAIEPHHNAFLARIDATAGPRWMPALRTRA